MDAVSDVKSRLSVDEVISDYLELRRAGSNLKGRCPFHDEKTPSFMVSPEKGIYHCFGCSEGGDMFEFVMKMDGIDFRQALEKLARKAGVDLSQYDSKPSNSRQKERLYELNSVAARYYQYILSRSPKALSYVREKRAINNQLIKDFMLGYASSQNKVSTFLSERGFDKDEISRAGLMSRSGKNELFYSRMMISLHDNQGRIIGFTGRVIGDGEPKYVNSPQTLLYDKSRYIFGLYQARDAIRKSKQAVLVEGNLDVIASHQAGVKNVVATAGTAATEQQLKQLGRLAESLVLAFDTDPAGLAATERVIPLAQKNGLTIKVAQMGKSKDPDELIKQSPSAWEKAIAEAEYVVDWLINHYKKVFDVQSSQGKVQFTDKIIALLRELPDPVEQDHYLAVLADITEVSPHNMKRKFSQKPIRKTQPEKKASYTVERIDDRRALEETILGLLLVYEETRQTLEAIETGLFSDETRQTIINYLQKHPTTTHDNVQKRLKEQAEYVKILVFKAEELFSDWSTTDRSIELHSLLKRLRSKEYESQKQRLTEAIKKAEKTGDVTTVEKLLQQYHSLLD